jgi:ketosteroid isomerase-like protein
MSQENVGVVRRAFDAYNHGDFEAASRFLDPEVEYITLADVVEPDTYRGHEDVLGYIYSLLADFEDWHTEPEDLIDVGEQVVVSVRATGKGKRSGVPVEITWTSVYSLRDGIIVRIRNYAEKAEALEAVGLRE